MRTRAPRQILTVAVVAATVLGLAGCASEELPDDEWACPHFAAITQKLSINRLDPSAEATTSWDEARASLADTEEMAGDDLTPLIAEARTALPGSPFGDVTEFNRVVREIDAACELPAEGFQILELELTD
ncbi:hypothetical protein N1028_08080 [Herbiconiux sp. CPCC 203407]|uniref:Lipoprotein n=1 Tax=Herbiconiux oxytropis TaxID=2970915 RepID=A0AA42BUY5_9MICO|nr:hypothetical protein [Herbiconiux oxytropis]MCS5722886.1 hypothetical protein [Herbiconiux oxytropis]MCS5725854.1 hypothetical protein [Herbiconiux oxytropis]